MLNAANKKTDKSQNFKTGISAAAHAILETEQLISHTRTAVIDTIYNVLRKGEVIPISKIHELLTKVHDILDGAASKWVGDTAHILAYL